MSLSDSAHLWMLDAIAHSATGVTTEHALKLRWRLVGRVTPDESQRVGQSLCSSIPPGHLIRGLHHLRASFDNCDVAHLIRCGRLRSLAVEGGSSSWQHLRAQYIDEELATALITVLTRGDWSRTLWDQLRDEVWERLLCTEHPQAGLLRAHAPRRVLARFFQEKPDESEKGVHP